jgi:hypothetical protein
MAMHIEAAGYAMMRLKEELIFQEFSDHGHAVFDNSLADTNGHTHGVDLDQTANYSVTFDDIIDAMGALVANEYVPTDILMHPLAWSIFAKDPILRNVMFTQGQIGQSIWTQMPDFDQTANIPWNIRYQVTPFMPFRMNDTLDSPSPAAGLDAANITDITIIDRNNAVVVLESEQMGITQFDDPRRDIQMAKLRERYGVGTLNGGKATAVIKNVRLVQNYAPINTVLNVTP